MLSPAAPFSTFETLSTFMNCATVGLLILNERRFTKLETMMIILTTDYNSRKSPNGDSASQNTGG